MPTGVNGKAPTTVNTNLTATSTRTTKNEFNIEKDKSKSPFNKKKNKAILERANIENRPRTFIENVYFLASPTPDKDIYSRFQEKETTKARLERVNANLDHVNTENRALSFIENIYSLASATPDKDIFSRFKESEPNKKIYDLSTHEGKREYKEALIKKALELNSDEKIKNAMILLNVVHFDVEIQRSKYMKEIIMDGYLFHETNKLLQEKVKSFNMQEEGRSIESYNLRERIGLGTAVAKVFFSQNLEITDESIQKALEEAAKELEKDRI